MFSGKRERRRKERGRSRGSGGEQCGCWAFLSTPLWYVFVVCGRVGVEGREKKGGKSCCGERRKKEEDIAIYKRGEVPDIGASEKGEGQ